MVGSYVANTDINTTTKSGTEYYTETYYCQPEDEIVDSNGWYSIEFSEKPIPKPYIDPPPNTIQKRMSDCKNPAFKIANNRWSAKALHQRV